VNYDSLPAMCKLQTHCSVYATLCFCAHLLQTISSSSVCVTDFMFLNAFSSGKCFCERRDTDARHAAAEERHSCSHPTLLNETHCKNGSHVKNKQNKLRGL
jgi:hypothetical protein